GLTRQIVNKLGGTLHGAAVQAPGSGDRRIATLEAIATLTGAKAIPEDLGNQPENTKLHDLGKTRKVVVDKDDTALDAVARATAARWGSCGRPEPSTCSGWRGTRRSARRSSGARPRSPSATSWRMRGSREGSSSRRSRPRRSRSAASTPRRSSSWT